MNGTNCHAGFVVVVQVDRIIKEPLGKQDFIDFLCLHPLRFLARKGRGTTETIPSLPLDIFLPYGPPLDPIHGVIIGGQGQLITNLWLRIKFLLGR